MGNRMDPMLHLTLKVMTKVHFVMLVVHAFVPELLTLVMVVQLMDVMIMLHPKKYVSGNLQNLQCDKSSLTPSRPMRGTATVSRVAPRKVVLTQTAAAHVVAENTLSAALTLADATDVRVDDKMIGMDIISTETHTADVPGASAQISDSTGSDGVFATTAKLGGFGLRSADKGIITNAANTLVVGDKIRIENQVRNVVFVSPMCVSTAADAANVDCSALTAVHYVEVDEPF